MLVLFSMFQLILTTQLKRKELLNDFSYVIRRIETRLFSHLKTFCVLVLSFVLVFDGSS